VTLPNPFVAAFRNSRGLQLIATDAEWTHGRGASRSPVAPTSWSRHRATGR